MGSILVLSGHFNSCKLPAGAELDRARSQSVIRSEGNRRIIGPKIPLGVPASDLRQASIDAGLDPDKWTYTKSPKGWEIRKGVFNVGTLVFEDHAKILVEALNARPS